MQEYVKLCRTTDRSNFFEDFLNSLNLQTTVVVLYFAFLNQKKKKLNSQKLPNKHINKDLLFYWDFTITWLFDFLYHLT